MFAANLKPEPRSYDLSSGFKFLLNLLSLFILLTFAKVQTD